jgi:hypothetical protein
MPMPLWGAIALSAGLGGAQQYLASEDQRKNQAAQNWREAQRDRTSYITGRGGQQSFTAQSPYTAMLGGALQGGVAGAAQYQNYKNAQAKNNLMNARAQSVMSSSPYSTDNFDPDKFVLKSSYGDY